MILWIQSYVVALVAFAVIDVGWIAGVVRPTYARHLPHLLADKVNLLAGGVFYLIFVAGIVYFAMQPGTDKSLLAVLRDGALYGLFTYATYSLTMQAVLKDVPTVVVVTDILWGAFLCAVVAAVSCWTVSKLFG
jgi:uncharacterized membrane protein